MSSLIASSVVVLAALAPVITADLLDQRRPIVRPAIPVEYPPIPSTFDELISSGDMTGVFRIVAVEPKLIEKGRSRTVLTCSQAQIVEVLRYRRAETLGKTVEVCQNGGHFQSSQGLIDYVDPGFPRFRMGMKVMLVLRWDEFYGAYECMFGPDSSYEFATVGEQEVVRTFGVSAVARSQRSRPASDVLTEARERIKR